MLYGDAVTIFREIVINNLLKYSKMTIRYNNDKFHFTQLVCNEAAQRILPLSFLSLQLGIYIYS